VRPDLRGGDFEREVLDHADSRQIEVMAEHGIETDRMFGEADRCEPARAELLVERGWVPDGDPPYVINRARIADLESPVIPDGYSIRTAAGVEEAAALAEVHRAAFPKAQWTAEMYRKVMESPGYDPGREVLAVAPDGSFAAFAVTWHDELNRTGLLEAVGTHSDHRRRGLGRAIVLAAARYLAEAGMEYATVANSGTNAASQGLYRSAGFEPWHRYDGYEKVIA
jgi:ribosomal protein S18 acetylase RimI-like enzyme